MISIVDGLIVKRVVKSRVRIMKNFVGCFRSVYIGDFINQRINISWSFGRIIYSKVEATSHAFVTDTAAHVTFL